MKRVVNKMRDFKLKLILSLLGGIIFSFIFIILTFALPAKDKPVESLKAPKGKLGKISESFKRR